MFVELSCNSYILKNENLKFESKRDDLDKIRCHVIPIIAGVNKWPSSSPRG